MSTTTHERVPDGSILAWTGGIAAAWLIAAFLRSGTTLHLGPLLLPLIPAILGRNTEHPIRLTLIGIVTAIGAIVVLFLTGNLSGPSLGAFPDALTESIAFLAIGSVVGLIIAASGRRRSR
ncbi:MAG: hypothetical protein M3112_07805 [Actinomycetia bacterium]|nr:hypothetical protein [Actinomycetes bacterium]